jgi:hypothetical protein
MPLALKLCCQLPPGDGETYGQMIKGPTAATGDQALELLLLQ